MTTRVKVEVIHDVFPCELIISEKQYSSKRWKVTSKQDLIPNHPMDITIWDSKKFTIKEK